MSWLNSVINRLPIELHIPGYQFCGPGTKLKKRLARGDTGINKLDQACREHDIAYSKNKDLKERHTADLQLANRAWERVTAADSNTGERLAAWAVTNGMKSKVKLGMGLKRKLRTCAKLGMGIRRKKRVARSRKSKTKRRQSFQSYISKAKKAVRLIRPPNLSNALSAAMKSYGSLGKKVTLPRVIPLAHSGGLLPLIPIFAGLSALGALSGGAAKIASVVKEADAARKQLAESNRHNKTMEAIAIGKGVYLKPYKKGMGVYLKPYGKN